MKCNKEPYTSVQAHEVIQRKLKVKKCRKSGGRPIHVYKCEICGYYHVTSRKQFTVKIK